MWDRFASKDITGIWGIGAMALKSVFGASLGLMLLASSSEVAQAKSDMWVELSGGFHTYAMSDVNDGIDNLNAQIATTNLAMGHLSGGLGISGQVGITWPGGAVLGVGYERLAAATDVGDATATVDYKLPANLFFSSLDYMLPSTSSSRFGIGASIGLVSTSGQLKVTVPGYGSESDEVTGSGIMVEARVMAQVTVSTNLGLVPTLGYRYARTGDLKYGGAIGSRNADYSGLAARIGLRLTLD